MMSVQSVEDNDGMIRNTPSPDPELQPAYVLPTYESASLANTSTGTS